MGIWWVGFCPDGIVSGWILSRLSFNRCKVVRMGIWTLVFYLNMIFFRVWFVFVKVAYLGLSGVLNVCGLTLYSLILQGSGASLPCHPSHMPRFEWTPGWHDDAWQHPGAVFTRNHDRPSCHRQKDRATGGRCCQGALSAIGSTASWG